MSKKNFQKISVHITSLGCPKNFVDSEIIAASLLKKGFELSNSETSANIILINTCGFIKAARDESAQHIRNALNWREKGKNRKVVLCGCLNQLKNHNELNDLISKADLRIGLNDIESAAEKIETLFKENNETIRNDISTPHYLPKAQTPRLQLTPQHYAYIKIADGCSNNCSYCSIPSIRGKFRSREPEDIIEEAKNLLRNGSRELILIAQDSTNYGFDLSKKSQIILILNELEQIESSEPIWIRLMYSHPKHFTDELLELFQNSKRLLPYIDLPLQHISDKILKLMNRGVSSAQCRELVKKIKDIKPHIALRTTFICGFPGETEEDFNELIDFVREISFDRLGAFSYSPESETKAFTLPNAVPQALSEERRKKLLTVQQKISLSNNKKLIGKKIEIIVDKSIDKKFSIGRTKYDAPDIDNIVEIESRKTIIPGNVIEAKIVSAKAYSLKAIYP